MSELREVFEMVTKQTEPDVDAWKDQERRQRKANRNKKIGAIAVAAAIGIVAVVVVIRAVDEGTGTQPSGQGTDTTEIPTEQAIPPLPSGPLEPGRYVFTSSDPGLDASHRITIEVPDGYMGFDDVAAINAGTNQEAWVMTSPSAVSTPTPVSGRERCCSTDPRSRRTMTWWRLSRSKRGSACRRRPASRSTGTPARTWSERSPPRRGFPIVPGL
jgi:hypothetical protein